MIVTVTRHPTDVAAIRQSGLRTTAALSLAAGLHAAARPDVELLVFDLRASTTHDEGLIDRLRGSGLPCPLLVRHDVSRESIATLYSLAQVDADIRPSFRPYDELSARIRSAAKSNDTNATRPILRGLSRVVEPPAREFVGAMAILGERPVMQSVVAGALGISRSSFRKWLADRRAESIDLPRFPRINAVFVALHLVWRRERLGWNGKRAAAAAGFTDEKTCATYLRYHFGRTSAKMLRDDGFDGLMTVGTQMFSRRSRPRGRHEAIRRI